MSVVPIGFQDGVNAFDVGVNESIFFSFECPMTHMNAYECPRSFCYVTFLVRRVCMFFFFIISFLFLAYFFPAVPAASYYFTPFCFCLFVYFCMGLFCLGISLSASFFYSAPS